jgi:ATP-dependent exoDNAse (exonuclease V) beta subunit
LLTIYSSSAGSGKTYTLAREYLKLALRHEAYYQYLLAVTFTNKAALEMKDRIIRFLQELAAESNPALAKQLSHDLKIPEKELAVRSSKTLWYLLQHYAFFSVGTIDSFFQRVIRSFARETGVSSGFQLEFDQERVLSEVVDRLLTDVGDDKYLTSWLVRFSSARIEEGAGWDVRKELKQFANQLMREDFKRIEEETSASKRDKKFFEDQLKKLYAMVQKTEAEAQQMGRNALELIRRHGLEVSDFSYGSSGVMRFFEKLSEKILEEPKPRALKALDDPTQWYTKTSSNKETIDILAREQLIPLLREAVSWYQEVSENYLTANEIKKYFHQYALLSDLSRKLTTYKKEEEIMLISDAAFFLREVIGGNDALFLYEKIGSFYHHYLLDEFQDTSSFQWLNFKPLVEDSLAQGYENLIVGDVKQSIYRWRGGNADILSGQLLEEMSPGMVQEKQLDVNYRSAQTVVDYNNAIFPSLTKHLQDILAEDAPGGTEEKLDQLYGDIVQRLPPAGGNRAGLVENFFFEPKDNDWKQQVLDRLPPTFESIQKCGINVSDIGVLVRTAREGILVADHLMAFRASGKGLPGVSYQVISDEALFLNNAPVINFIIRCLQYLDNPDDAVVAFNVVRDFYAYIRVERQSSLFRQESRAPGPKESKVFLAELQEIRNFPLLEQVDWLLRKFQLYELDGQQPYLQRFQDITSEYVMKNNAGITGFLNWWSEEGEKLRLSIPEKSNGARILTIHKSKGLQFKAVIIPFLDWNLDHQSRQENLIWLSTENTPFAALGHVPVKYHKALNQTAFATAYYKERMQAHVDNFNLLYVAFTRAEDVLVSFSPSGASKTPSSVGQLLYDHLKKQELLEQTEEGVEQYQTGDWPVLTEASGGGHLSVTGFQNNDWSKKMMIRSSMGENFNDFTLADQHRRRGIFAHKILASLNHHENLPETLDQLFITGEMEDTTFDLLKTSLEKLFQLEEMKNWFSGSYESIRERPVLTPGGEMKIPDRVLVDEEKTILLEFKTGEPQKRYVDQVRNYRQLLAEMGHQRIESYLVYLDSQKIEPV